MMPDPAMTVVAERGTPETAAVKVAMVIVARQGPHRRGIEKRNVIGGDRFLEKNVSPLVPSPTIFRFS